MQKNLQEEKIGTNIEVLADKLNWRQGEEEKGESPSLSVQSTNR